MGILWAYWLQVPAAWLALPALATILATALGWPRWERVGLLLLWLSTMLCGAWRLALADPRHDPLAVLNLLRSPAGAGELLVRGEISAPPVLEGHARRLLVSVEAVSNDSGLHWWPRHGQIAVFTSGSLLDDPYGPAYGDEVVLRGRLQPPLGEGSPDLQALMAFPRLSVRHHGGNPVLALLYKLRFWLAMLIGRLLPQPEAALLVAVLLGLRMPALEPLTPLFKVTGTAHLIVPSGFKVTLLAGLVALPLHCLIRRKADDWRLLPAQRRRSQRGQWLLCLFQLLVVAVYTVLSGAGPAALRAGLMGALLVLAPRVGRRYHVYSALAAAALVMSWGDPFVLWDSGFQLSFLGTLGIVLLTPLFSRPLKRLERLPAGTSVVEAVAVTLAAQVATLPIFALTFAQLSLVAPLANLLTVPLLELLLLLGVVLCLLGVVCFPLALIVGWLAWFPLRYVVGAVTLCAHLPAAWLSTAGWALPLPLAWSYYVALLIALALGWRLRPQWFLSPPAYGLQRTEIGRSVPGRGPRHRRALVLGVQMALALLLLLTTGVRTLLEGQRTGLVLTVFTLAGPSGETGPAIVGQTAQGRLFVIDGGPDAAALTEVLDQRLPLWQHHIDWLALSSPLHSHLAGLLDITSRFAIGSALDGGVLHPGSAYALWRRTLRTRAIPYQTLRRGQVLPLENDLRLEVLWPSSPLHRGGDEARNNALVLRLITPALRLLLLGEAAQSSYALNGLLTAAQDAGPLAWGQEDVVVASLPANKPPSPAFMRLLELLHPSLLVVNEATNRSSGRTQTSSTTEHDQLLTPVTQRITRTLLLRPSAAFSLWEDATAWSFDTTGP